MPPKVIAHIDMDAFFAAVEQRDNPKLRGKPVVIGSDPKRGAGRGVVSTCSYEARKFGIHSAMPISKAYRLCPHAIFLPVDFKKYNEASDKIFDIFYDFTPDIEPISIDEAFLDITGSFHFFKTPLDTCRKIKERIKVETQLIASIGIAPIKMAAKIASDLSKPDGLLEVRPENVLDFLWPLPVEKLWGVGAKTKAELNRLGIKTIGDLAHQPVGEDQAVGARHAVPLQKHFGIIGQHLHDLANGIDPRDVAASDEAKSVSHEHTFDTDTSDRELIHSTLLFLSEKVSRRLRKLGLKGKTLTLKIRLEGFKTCTKAFTFTDRTNFTDTIYEKSKELFDEFYKYPMRIRLIGVRLSHFEDAYFQENLFENKQDIRLEKIHKAVDLIKDKFGDGAIHRGGADSD